MASRKYSFANLTQDQLVEIGKIYPKATEAGEIKPVYKQLAMLVECGAYLPEGVVDSIVINSSAALEDHSA